MSRLQDAPAGPAGAHAGRLLPASRNSRLLVAVSVVYWVLQLALIGPTYGLGWDEAVYLSQVDPSAPDAYWSPVRAWGVPALAAPVAALSPGLVLTRLYFATVSSLGLYLAFRTWLRVSDSPAVPLAALLFSTVWVTVYFGVYVMPNLYVGLGSVAATAFFLRSGRPGATVRDVLGLGACVAFVALMRPSDSLWLVAPLGLVWLLARSWRRLGVLAALVAGVVLGWVPWVVDSYVAGSSPLERFRAASDSVGGGLHLDLALVSLYGRMSDAPIMCYCMDDVDRAGPPNPVTYAWWAAAAALAVTGLVGVRRARGPATAVLAPRLLPAVVGASLAFPYLFLVDYGILRALLPALALFSLPAAWGLLALADAVGRGGGSRGAVAVVAVVAVAHVALQVNHLRLHMPTDRAMRQVTRDVALALERLGVGAPCFVAGHTAPNVAYYADCASTPALDYLQRPPGALTAALRNGEDVAVVSRRAAPRGSYLRQWREVRLDLREQPGWRVYLPPTGGGPAP